MRTKTYSTLIGLMVMALAVIGCGGSRTMDGLTTQISGSWVPIDPPGTSNASLFAGPETTATFQFNEDGTGSKDMGPFRWMGTYAISGGTVTLSMEPIGATAHSAGSIRESYYWTVRDGELLLTAIGAQTKVVRYRRER